MQEVWVRIPIAPPQFKAIIRKPEPRVSEGLYSSKVPQRQRYEVPYIHSDKASPPTRAAGTASPWPGAQAAQGLLTRQNAHFSLPVTLVPLSVCGPVGSPAARVLRVTLATCADGQLGLVAPFAVVISPGCAGSAVRGLKSAEIMPPAVAPRVVAALRPQRLGPMAPTRRRDRVALGTSSAGARLFCAEAHVVRRGRSARRG